MPRTKQKDDYEVEGDEEFNYEEDLAIDPDYLDAEFMNHPTVFMKYAAASARASKKAKMAEERLKTLRSQLIKDANENPDGTLGKGIKANAQIVEAFYRCDEDYKKAKKAMIEAQFEADLLNNAVFAFQARKSALENLVRLHGQEYFSTPQEPRDLPEAAERLAEIKKKSARSKVRERMNK